MVIFIGFNNCDQNTISKGDDITLKDQQGNILMEGISNGFNVSGYVFDSIGALIIGPFMGPPTTIKVVELNLSVQPDFEGYYEINNISEGTYTIRAYFGSVDHSVIYRELRIFENTKLNWTIGKTWVTGRVFDASGFPVTSPFMGPPTMVKHMASDYFVYPDSKGYYELENISIGEWITVRTFFGSIDFTGNYVHLRANGSNPIEIDFHNGRNSLHGFVYDSDGVTPLSGSTIMIDNKVTSAVTDHEGYYLIQNISVGETYNVTALFQGKGNETSQQVIEFTEGNFSHLNFTYQAIMKIIPEQPVFKTGSFLMEPGTVEITWNRSENANGYRLMRGEVVLYDGNDTAFTYSTEVEESVELFLIAYNDDGNSEPSEMITIIFKVDVRDIESWIPGMEWSYYVEAISDGKLEIDNITYKVISREVKNGKESFKVKGSWESDPDHIHYLWYDVLNYDIIATLDISGPITVHGSHEWIYSSDKLPLSPGKILTIEYHKATKIPFYDDPILDNASFNFSVNGMENITTPAGKFECLNVTIVDTKDGFVAWNYYYSEELQHWVKMNDRLPLSRADEIYFTLTDFNFPTVPVIITEAGTLKERNFNITWDKYPDALNYTLYENDVEIFSGPETSYSLTNRDNGEYSYRVRAELSTGQSGSSEPITITVNWSLPSPEFITPSSILNIPYLIIEWTFVDEADGYVLLENGIEIYSGPSTLINITKRTAGDYRFRVKVQNLTYGDSDLSDSLLIKFEFIEEDNQEENKKGKSPTIMVILATIIIFALVTVLIIVKGSLKKKIDQGNERSGEE
jgi:hypothetical protein